MKNTSSSTWDVDEREGLYFLQCKGISRKNWIEKIVVAKDDIGNDIAHGLIMNCTPNDLLMNMEGLERIMLV